MVSGNKSSPKCLYDRWDDGQKLFGQHPNIHYIQCTFYKCAYFTFYKCASLTCLGQKIFTHGNFHRESYLYISTECNYKQGPDARCPETRLEKNFLEAEVACRPRGPWTCDDYVGDHDDDCDDADNNRPRGPWPGASSGWRLLTAPCRTPCMLSPPGAPPCGGSGCQGSWTSANTLGRSPAPPPSGHSSLGQQWD